ncbi:MAG: penicillin-binding protein 1A [Pseudomonadota bacterium]
MSQSKHKGAAPRERHPAPAAPLSWGRRSVKILASLIGLLTAGAVAVAMLLAIALAVAHRNLPDIGGLTDYRPKLPMRIYSSDNLLLGEFGEERRLFVPAAQIPKVMKEAVLAIEDSRFYQHSGVDYIGVLRAGLSNFGESRAQGASTITMQLARNFYLSSERTFTRKIYEILLALKIERQLSKDQILEVYMNQIFLGKHAYGFAAASEIYFGKPLKDVTVAEAAMLAGLPKAPSAYNPLVNPTRATRRQLYIIDRMLENGFITQAQHEEGRAQEMKYRASSDAPTHSEYATESARQLIFNQYGEDAYSRGLNVHLTLDAAQQQAAYRAMRKGILDFERRQVYRGPEAFVALPSNPKDWDAKVGEVLGEHPDQDELKAGVAVEVSPRKVVVMLQNGEAITVTGDGLKPVASGLLTNRGNPNTQIKVGSVVRMIQSTKGDWSITQVPEVEGAFVALDPKTGAIKAMVGGFDYSKNKFNHVTQAWRQPGSSFKPFIYSAALEKGFTPATVVNDAPLLFGPEVTGGRPWEPKNYDGTFDGPLSMRRGLAKSKNMISIRILNSIGAGYAQTWISRFGFEPEKHPAYLTMALGAGSTTPLQMATAYSVFANGGYRVTPMLISKITDSSGKVLNEFRPPALDESMRTLEARNAFVMNSLLQEVTRSGTAARAQSTLKRSDLYGKTGTTNDSMDAWFAGYQRNLVAVSWLGYDTPRKLGDRETGGGLALPIWIDFMAVALKGVPVSETTAPEGVVNVSGEWFFSEFAHNQGVTSLGLEEVPPEPPAPVEEERRSILDLFSR